jgi:hypothetical protein
LTLVVDTNVVAALFLPSPQTPTLRNLILTDSDRRLPMLWRSEFRHVLEQAHHIHGLFGLRRQGGLARELHPHRFTGAEGGRPHPVVIRISLGNPELGHPHKGHMQPGQIIDRLLQPLFPCPHLGIGVTCLRPEDKA